MRRIYKLYKGLAKVLAINQRAVVVEFVESTIKKSKLTSKLQKQIMMNIHLFTQRNGMISKVPVFKCQKMALWVPKLEMETTFSCQHPVKSHQFVLCVHYFWVRLEPIFEFS